MEKVDRRTWSSDDVRDFLSFVESDRLYAAYVLLLTTGMRRGEVLGLRWQDLDLDAAELAIVQTLNSVRSELVFSTPKTKRSRRLVYLDDATVEKLRGHRASQRTERMAAGPDWAADFDPVFCDELGARMSRRRSGVTPLTWSPRESWADDAQAASSSSSSTRLGMTMRRPSRSAGMVPSGT